MILNPFSTNLSPIFNLILTSVIVDLTWAKINYYDFKQKAYWRPHNGRNRQVCVAYIDLREFDPKDQKAIGYDAHGKKGFRSEVTFWQFLTGVSIGFGSTMFFDGTDTVYNYFWPKTETPPQTQTVLIHADHASQINPAEIVVKDPPKKETSGSATTPKATSGPTLAVTKVPVTTTTTTTTTTQAPKKAETKAPKTEVKVSFRGILDDDHFRSKFDNLNATEVKPEVSFRGIFNFDDYVEIKLTSDASNFVEYNIATALWKVIIDQWMFFLPEALFFTAVSYWWFSRTFEESYSGSSSANNQRARMSRVRRDVFSNALSRSRAGSRAFSGVSMSRNPGMSTMNGPGYSRTGSPMSRSPGMSTMNGPGYSMAGSPMSRSPVPGMSTMNGPGYSMAGSPGMSTMNGPGYSMAGSPMSRSPGMSTVNGPGYSIAGSPRSPVSGMSQMPRISRPAAYSTY